MFCLIVACFEWPLTKKQQHKQQQQQKTSVTPAPDEDNNWPGRKDLKKEHIKRDNGAKRM